MKLINNTLNDIHNIMEPSGKVSEKYKHLPDSYFLSPLVERGFTIDSTEVSGGPLGKRLITLSHPELKIGSDNINVVAANSHDGTKGFNLFLGVFRLVCSNGMIVGESFTSNKSIRHRGGNFLTKVDDRIDELMRETDRLFDVVAKMKSTTTISEDFIRRAMLTRFQDSPEDNKFYKSLNLGGTVRREADASDDLWTVFNRVQEDLIRGGFKYRLDSKGESSIRTAKPLTSMDAKVRVNQALWDLAMSEVA